MNVRRSLSRHQDYYLRQIGLGKIVLVWDEDYRRYVEVEGHFLMPVGGGSKPRGARLARCGNHFSSSVIELLQRGLLVDNGSGRLVPSRDAARQYGRPRPLPVPKRTFKMHRTRAARVQ